MNAKEKQTEAVPLPVASTIVVKVTRRTVNEHLMDQVNVHLMDQEYVLFVLFKTWTLPADRVQTTVTATPKLDMKCPLTQLDRDFVNVTEPRTNSPSMSVKVIATAAQQRFVPKTTVKLTSRGAKGESVLFASIIISL